MFELRHTDEKRSYDDLVISTEMASWLHYRDLVKMAESLSRYNKGIFYIKRIEE